VLFQSRLNVVLFNVYHSCGVITECVMGPLLTGNTIVSARHITSVWSTGSARTSRPVKTAHHWDRLNAMSRKISLLSYRPAATENAPTVSGAQYISHTYCPSCMHCIVLHAVCIRPILMTKKKIW